MQVSRLGHCEEHFGPKRELCANWMRWGKAMMLKREWREKRVILLLSRKSLLFLLRKTFFNTPVYLILLGMWIVLVMKKSIILWPVSFEVSFFIAVVVPSSQGRSSWCGMMSMPKISCKHLMAAGIQQTVKSNYSHYIFLFSHYRERIKNLLLFACARINACARIVWNT